MGEPPWRGAIAGSVHARTAPRPATAQGRAAPSPAPAGPPQGLGEAAEHLLDPLLQARGRLAQQTRCPVLLALGSLLGPQPLPPFAGKEEWVLHTCGSPPLAQRHRTWKRVATVMQLLPGHELQRLQFLAAHPVDAIDWASADGIIEVLLRVSPLCVNSGAARIHVDAEGLRRDVAAVPACDAGPLVHVNELLVGPLCPPVLLSHPLVEGARVWPASPLGPHVAPDRLRLPLPCRCNVCGVVPHQGRVLHCLLIISRATLGVTQ
mmetsp:Transcript_115220/g.321063  ORF Transcript_115220/g.321063 Transcript_115220/m.321063 type:complete len:264 (-) Transcript_115220:321-1112(-)